MARKSRYAIQEEISKTISKIYNVGLYLRLSEQDKKDEISNSINNQKRLLQAYLNENPNLIYIDTYVDDGKTGTNFNRPGFQRLMADIQRKRIDCIVTKDLSRIGRNYIETGNLLESVFPFLGIRLISVTEHFDTNTANDSEYSFIIPLRNLMNDRYVMDISRKRKTTGQIMMQKGEYIGSIAVYGYQKSKENPKKLIIDMEAAKIVRLIFQLAENGLGSCQIAKYLNRQNYLSPYEYKVSKGLVKKKEDTTIRLWRAKSVRLILKNRIYTGALVQGKLTTSTPKGKMLQLPSEKWMVIENAQEPIIPKEQYDAVQRKMEERRKKFGKKQKMEFYDKTEIPLALENPLSL